MVGLSNSEVHGRPGGAKIRSSRRAKRREQSDALVTVEAAHADVLFDPTWAHCEQPAHWLVREERVAAVGDRVLVAARLVHGPDDGPHRASARVVRAGHRRVTIGLLGSRS